MKTSSKVRRFVFVSSGLVFLVPAAAPHLSTQSSQAQLAGLSFSSTDARAQAPAFLNQGLVAYYPFNGNANDESGNQHTGIVVNAVLQADRFNKAGQSYQFNGTNSYVLVSNSTELAPVGDFTLSLWMNQKTTDAPQVLVSKSLSGDNTSGWHLAAQTTPKTLSFQAAPNFSPTAPNILPPPISNWVHVTFTYVRSSGAWGMYLDGVLKGSGTQVFSLNNVDRPLVIGAQQYPGPPFRYFFNGGLDDIRIYNRALSGAEVKALYDYESVPPTQNPRIATAVASLVNGFVVGATITDSGFGYTVPPVVLLRGGGGIGATAFATVANGIVTGIIITDPGTGYTSTPRVSIASPPFSPKLSVAVSRVNVTQSVVLGRKYRLEASQDLGTWNPVGAVFVAESEELVQEFVVAEVGQFFRLTEVP